MDLAFIPSPSRGVLYLGPVPLRGYAFCIIIGVFVAVWLGGRRWVARGGTPGTVADIAVWAVPFGLVGGRLYHVITDYELYFSPGRNWVDAFKIWEGGLGIWGAIALGAVGAWIGCRRRGIPLPAWADAVAPGVAFAQALGRWGNWFNQELYGRATDLPWALKITSTEDGRVPGTYHPTFLYESLWCVLVALLVIWADRRFKLGHGRAIALYVAAYCAGRAGTEYLRVDTAHHVLGLRLNEWTSVIIFLLAVIYFIVSARLRPGRETLVEPAAAIPPAYAKDGAGTETDGASETGTAKAPAAQTSGVEDGDGAAASGTGDEAASADASASDADGTEAPSDTTASASASDDPEPSPAPATDSVDGARAKSAGKS